ncbi:MAG: hypothetical protein LBV60_26740, partial [Streptomyces sp.]|nr:hypothetical protein [Streptomyces sp.]
MLRVDALRQLAMGGFFVTDSKKGGTVHLSKEAIELYGRLLKRDTQVRGEPGLDELIEHNLATEDYWVRDGNYVALSASSALRQHFTQAFTGIEDILGLARQYDSLLETLPSFDGADSGGVRFLSTPQECSAILLQALHGMTRTMWSAQPVDRDSETLEKSLPQDIQNLQRGIEYRTIFLDAARQRPHQIKWADAVTELGGEVRTLPGDFHRAVIIDGRAAMISDHRAGPGYLNRYTGWFITHPGMVAHIVDVYQEQWDRANSWKSPQIRNVDTAELTSMHL